MSIHPSRDSSPYLLSVLTHLFVFFPVNSSLQTGGNLDSLSLTEEEAANLAAELKALLSSGQSPQSDKAAIERMVAGLGDPRGLLRLTFAESLGTLELKLFPHCVMRCAHILMSQFVEQLPKLPNSHFFRDCPPSLLQALVMNDDPVVQGSAVGAMASIGSSAVAGLLQIIVDPSSTPMQTGLASWGLSFVGARAPEALKAAATDLNPLIRTAAIAALGDQIQSLEDIEARDLVLASLSDVDDEVRAEAATLLGKLLEGSWRLPNLQPLLSDPSSQVRKNTALSMMKLGDAQALNHLKAALSAESDVTVSRVISLAISQLQNNS